MKELQSGQPGLKHAETVDKSKPLIDKDVHIAKNKHGELMSEVAKGADLKHAETKDRSAPVIEEGVSVKKVDRKGFLDEVAKAGKLGD